MKQLLKASVLVFFLSVSLAGFARAEGPAVATPNKTLENLNAAYNGESNAHARYLAFAQKADEEGYGQAASLFRAASAAEKIHLENHAKVITAMGGTPKADIVPPVVKSTKENVEAALQGESYERDTMYPGFMAEAQAAGNKDAFRTFNLAKSVEAEHAKLYKEALDNLEQWKGGKKDFYVCAVCGNTVTALDFANCPICNNPKEQFNKIN